MATEIGMTKAKAAAPPVARMIRISWVAYAVDDSASEEKTARPIALPIASCGASAVGRGRPKSHVRQERRGAASASRRPRGVSAPGRMKEESMQKGRSTLAHAPSGFRLGARNPEGSGPGVGTLSRAVQAPLPVAFDGSDQGYRERILRRGGKGLESAGGPRDSACGRGSGIPRGHCPGSDSNRHELALTTF